MRERDRSHTNNTHIDDFRRDPKPNHNIAVSLSKGQIKRSNHKILITGVCIFLVVLIASAGGFLYLHRTKTPIPKNITQSVDFPLYYPSTLPEGYKLDTDSIKNTVGVVFFTLKSGGRQIVLSEQEAPTNPPDFDAIQKAYSSFKKTDAAGGKGVIGSYQKAPTAIILTNATLINISASKDTPSDVLVKLIKNLQSLPT